MSESEKMFGPKKKVIEAKDLPPSPKPFSSHDDHGNDGEYIYDLHDYEKPLMTEEQAQARYEEAQAFEDARTPAPSQGSAHIVGVARDMLEKTQERELTNPRYATWKERNADNSKNKGRKTYRVGEFSGEAGIPQVSEEKPQEGEQAI